MKKNLFDLHVCKIEQVGGEGIRTLINSLTAQYISAGERIAALPPHPTRKEKMSQYYSLKQTV